MLGCTCLDVGTVSPIPLEESALTGVQLHLSPISLRLVSVSLKGCHDKTGFILQNANQRHGT